MENLEAKAESENSGGKKESQLLAEGYKPLSSSTGYMFKHDGKPRLWKLNPEKKLYFPSNPTSSL
jgi:hypothetical protein